MCYNGLQFYRLEVVIDEGHGKFFKSYENRYRVRNTVQLLLL